ncbi:hypothetical protein LguiA_001568 [Lonicera macranthoides]
MVMGMEKRSGLGVFCAMMVFVLLKVQVGNAAVYKVGGPAGWTTMGNIDYQKLADANTFHVGDTLIFTYLPTYHNVMQVTNAAYKSCNSSAPIATYRTGNDSITVTTGGHHYFLCGTPGHCQIGQKVDINVLLVSSMASTPSPMPSPSVPPVMVPQPTLSEATPLHASRFLANLGLAMVVIAKFYM